MSKDKIEPALSAALKHLEDSLKSLSDDGRDQAVPDSLWLTSAETEYAVFLLSLVLGEKAENATWKQGPASLKPSVEFKPVLTSAYKLLQNARTNVDAGNLEKSYEEAWTAKNLLLKIQELLEKKRKEVKK